MILVHLLEWGFWSSSVISLPKAMDGRLEEDISRELTLLCSSCPAPMGTVQELVLVAVKWRQRSEEFLFIMVGVMGGL